MRLTLVLKFVCGVAVVAGVSALPVGALQMFTDPPPPGMYQAKGTVCIVGDDRLGAS